MFEKGYRVAKEVAQNSPKYFRTCFNCQYFFKTDKDSEEVCQNDKVLRYDMIMTDTAIYCNRWKLHGSTVLTAKDLFKKGLEDESK